MASLPVKKTGTTGTRPPLPGPATKFSQIWVKPAPFRLERQVALMVIVTAALYLRIQSPEFSTAFMDESIYVLYGRMFLSHSFVSSLSSPLQWSFGWYLWPAMAAIADFVGGLVGLRLLAALLGTITVMATYGFASRLFSKQVGLIAASVMAALGPAVMTSRIATRDSGALCFFALGLWLLACAWQDNKKRQWILAAACFLAAFLCKYLVAIYFPFLFLLPLMRGKRPALLFSLPLLAGCAAYAAIYSADLIHLLRYGSAYSSLRAPAGEAWKVYLRDRLDLWLLAVATLPVFAIRAWRVKAFMLWVGAAVLLVAQAVMRADFDFWKHVNYALLFLVPLAAAAVLFAVQKLQEGNYAGQLWWGVGATIVLACGLGYLGSFLNIDRFVFWPNVEPAVAYFETQPMAKGRVLVDDTVMRYYFMRRMSQADITDPMYFSYGGKQDQEAYQAAVRDGAFAYIVLDGGIGQEARRMDATIRPLLGGYTLVMRGVDPTLGQPIEVYAKSGLSVPAATGSTVQLQFPATNSVVSATANAVTAQGVVQGAQANWFVRIDVFTNHWYEQGGNIPIAADGTFHQVVYLGGEGKQQCYHLIRAKVFDPTGKFRAVALNYAVARANADGSTPGCR
ncbi:MAG TPA: glycosyltransferase family 39 protein [Alphaproteobacteria bacterium]|nr:glycosyltransferase family 39 protein [Alphaproteobacteria bacterium]